MAVPRVARMPEPKWERWHDLAIGGASQLPPGAGVIDATSRGMGRHRVCCALEPGTRDEELSAWVDEEESDATR